MIDIDREQLCLLAQISKEIPGRPHVSTIFRWWRSGVKGIKLETVMVGGRRFTSIEAVRRFVARRNQTETIESAASQVIEGALDDLGIK